MSNEPEHRTRHYPVVDALVRRTSIDGDWDDRRDAAAAGLLAAAVDLGPAAPALVSSAHGAFERVTHTGAPSVPPRASRADWPTEGRDVSQPRGLP